MSYCKGILICGGDKRQKYMYEYMKEKGLNVSTFGLYEYDMNEIENIKNYDVVILPVPVSKDGEYLNCSVKIRVDDILNLIDENQVVLGGVCNRWDIVDYYKEEEFQMQNALPTAEGALQTAMENTDITLNNSQCAVLGYGRISKVLSAMLKSLGAYVTVYARNPRDIALAKALGYDAGDIRYLENIDRCDVIFNTVPTMVLDSRFIDKLKEEVLLIELASKPYGIDMEAADKLNKRVIIASGLPGKVAPKTSGKILCDVVMDILVRMEV